jgi:hypothetical protein
MMHARWQIDARFGHKQDVIERLPRDAAPQAGLNTSHLLTGSIGALEATVEHSWHVDSLADLEQAWTKLAALGAHQQWGKDLEPFVVSGTARWSVWRLL